MLQELHIEEAPQEVEKEKLKNYSTEPLNKSEERRSAICITAVEASNNLVKRDLNEFRKLLNPP